MRQLVPYISSPAGARLTQDNWVELGIKMLAYDFSELVMKPGLAYLQTLENIRSYFGWSQDVVLDAGALILNAHGEFQVKSHYDGTTYRFTADEFWTAIEGLQPTMVVLPKGMASTAFYPKLEGTRMTEDCMSAGYDLSDSPTMDGYACRVYRLESGIKRTVSILDSVFAQHFKPMDTECTCPTCKQLLTCAYLHYLYQSTPLLCQRYLIMHNIHVAQL